MAIGSLLCNPCTLALEQWEKTEKPEVLKRLEPWSATDSVLCMQWASERASKFAELRGRIAGLETALFRAEKTHRTVYDPSDDAIRRDLRHAQDELKQAMSHEGTSG
jgi:hypothetical protein